MFLLQDSKKVIKATILIRSIVPTILWYNFSIRNFLTSLLVVRIYQLPIMLLNFDIYTDIFYIDFYTEEVPK